MLLAKNDLHVYSFKFSTWPKLLQIKSAENYGKVLNLAQESNYEVLTLFLGRKFYFE